MARIDQNCANAYLISEGTWVHYSHHPYIEWTVRLFCMLHPYSPLPLPLPSLVWEACAFSERLKSFFVFSC